VQQRCSDISEHFRIVLPEVVALIDLRHATETTQCFFVYGAVLLANAASPAATSWNDGH